MLTNSLLMRYHVHVRINNTNKNNTNKNNTNNNNKNIKTTDVFGHGFKSTKNQDKYIESLNSKRIIIAQGPPGSGKTMLACSHAIQELNNMTYKKVLITRPAVSVDEEHGFLPGDLNQKLHPWMIPIYDNFTMFAAKSTLDHMLNSGKIEIVPLSFIRGRTFHDCFIIADEMQNATQNQIKTLLTRIGLNSTMVITGDLSQCDLKTEEENGLLDFITRFQNYKITNSITDDEFIDVVELDKSDIQRSESVARILDIYDMDEKQNNLKI